MFVRTSRLTSRPLLGLLVLAVSCSPSSSADDAKELQLPPAYKSLVAGADAIASSGKELIPTERTRIRLAMIRSALTLHLLQADFHGAMSLQGPPKIMPDTKDYPDIKYPDLSSSGLLCMPREKHLELAAQYGYLSSVVSRIKDLAKPTPPSDLISALTLLSRKYVAEPGATISDADLEKLKAEGRSRCKQDLKGYDSDYYGFEIRDYWKKGKEEPEAAGALPSLSFLGPVGILIDTLVGVITPVIEEIAGLVDQAKREQAIRTFLTDQKNQDAIKKAGHALALSVSSRALSERRKLAGAFVDGLTNLRSTTVDLSKLHCSNDSDHLSRVDDAPNPKFVACWRSVWNELEPAVSSLLKTATDYDQLADAGDTRASLKLFDQITQDLSAIRENAITHPNLFWGDVMSLINLAKAVETALSKESRDKIHAAVDGLTKSP